MSMQFVIVTSFRETERRMSSCAALRERIVVLLAALAKSSCAAYEKWQQIRCGEVEYE